MYMETCGPGDPVTVVSVLGRADVDRRSFLRRAAYSVALTATGLAALPDVARIVGVTESSRVGAAEVEAVQRVTDSFAALDEVRGGGFGRTAVAEFLATDVSTLLRSQFAHESIKSEMFSAAAELAYLCGFKSHDGGLDAVAQRYYLAALRLAQESGIPGRDAWVFRILSLHSADVGHPDHAVPLAERAVSIARGRFGPDAIALHEAALARAYAETGNQRGAREVISRIQPVIDSPDITSELPRWIALSSPNGATRATQTAKAFAALHDWGNAERYQHLSAQVWNPGTHPRIHALTSAETGLIRWSLGRHEDAAKLWRSALPVLDAVDSERTANVVSKIRKVAPELVGSNRITGQ
ncbi:hypothetical protein DFR68_11956 [Nocardia mexicana]|uniref:Tetratricopeptide repeat protein n=2 Tax=Nocardia mexicana TaxID=279262 RepID=A0A370GK68_9NOCA|nr:hypothetical protein DFR68_11956 [Nocardia mexicana]